MIVQHVTTKENYEAMKTDGYIRSKKDQGRRSKKGYGCLGKTQAQTDRKFVFFSLEGETVYEQHAKDGDVILKFDFDALIQAGAKVRLESSSFTEAVNRRFRTNFSLSGVRGKRAYEFIEKCSKMISYQCDPEVMISTPVSVDMIIEAEVISK